LHCIVAITTNLVHVEKNSEETAAQVLGQWAFISPSSSLKSITLRTLPRRHFCIMAITIAEQHVNVI
jgi:hypothetical protein